MNDSVRVGKNVIFGDAVMIAGASVGTIGFTCGSFDLLHAGHMLMLAEAKDWCDYLIVGLQSNPTLDRPDKNQPIMSLEERKILLEGNAFVDEIIVYNTEADLLNLLESLKLDVRIVGADWEGKPYTGHELDIKVRFNTRTHNYSSSELRRRVYVAESNKVNDQRL